MPFIAIVDLRSNNGHVAAIKDNVVPGRLPEIKQFETWEDVQECHSGHMLEMFPWIIVDLDEGIAEVL